MFALFEIIWFDPDQFSNNQTIFQVQKAHTIAHSYSAWQIKSHYNLIGFSIAWNKAAHIIHFI